MKVIKKAVPVLKSKSKSKGKSADRSYVDIREEFLAMKPVDLRKLGIVGTSSHRPFISGVASANDMAYISTKIPGTNDVVFIACVQE